MHSSNASCESHHGSSWKYGPRKLLTGICATISRKPACSPRDSSRLRTPVRKVTAFCASAKPMMKLGPWRLPEGVTMKKMRSNSSRGNITCGFSNVAQLELGEGGSVAGWLDSV